MNPKSTDDSLTKDVRIFMDGAFDLMHYGHMNAFRLGRSLGTYLIVGVNSDSSITECKGPPLMNDQERLTMVKSCKFVDEVIPDCPYVMDIDYINWVVETYQIDYVVHGDDPCIVNGKDVYETAKAAGKFRSIPRTNGISTTDIIGRILLLAENPRFDTLYVDKNNTDSEASDIVRSDAHEAGDATLSLPPSTLLCHRSVFLTTSRIIRLFHDHNNSVMDTLTQKRHTVYIDGSWDMFNPGHVALLEAAKKRGTSLIVGVYNDHVVNDLYGMNLPVLNLHERVLSILGCRYVDDILIDAPYVVTSDMIATLGIDEIVQVHRTKNGLYWTDESANDVSRYQVAIEKGIFHSVQVIDLYQIETIIQQIKNNHSQFQAKYKRKQKAEQEYMLSVVDKLSALH